MKHVGILGGTFDIVHNGHLEVAQVVANVVGLDKVLFVTAGEPPHKLQTGVTASEIRHELVESAVAGLPGLEASRIELDLPGVSYTYRTVAELKAMLSAQVGAEVKISFILSAEYLNPANPSNVTLWEEAQAFLSMVQLVVVPRFGYSAEQARAWARELNLTNVHILEQPVSELSSGVVREALKQGLPIDSMVPALVAEKVKTRGIVYR
ncbi:MAG: nicotinate (nicotinamide) nucleotide adenylyltransferase [Cyanobacteria bacterium SZAS LIN-3]|nr:nicotinate (nicotinamide) nucleotide adenylyltransferase [Cyanobacteria bacterium SZAS LIN-3]MBS2010589.1 nicotinate (nicotinamide) nucleotide adenylyltransferase [Cyanobacteria bacterium SZAS TMP-1]